jgi:hypothetical protein
MDAGGNHGFTSCDSIVLVSRGVGNRKYGSPQTDALTPSFHIRFPMRPRQYYFGNGFLRRFKRNKNMKL